MKKLLSLLLLITVMAVSLFGCNKTPKCFSGEWKFSSISKIELVPDLDQTTMDYVKQEYNAEDEAGILANALDKFVTDGTFAPCYVKFDKKYTYTYDPAMDREATWQFYQLTEDKGFISFYAELDASAGNPDPVLYPDLVYDAESDTMYMTINYLSFMVTVALVR